MSSHNAVVTKVYTSAANYTTKVGYAVYLSDSATKTVTLAPDGTTAPILGIIDSAEDATNGQVTVVVNGLTRVKLGGAVTETQTMLTATTGGVLKAAASGDYVIGVALIDTDAVSDDEVPMIIDRCQLN